MAEASIPVDLTNPGQVFACLGFLEAADTLLGEAKGGFDWRKTTTACFQLAAGGDENPVAHVLDFLRQAHVAMLIPSGSTYDEAKLKKWKVVTETVESSVFPFPAPKEPSTLPACLKDGNGRRLIIDHWGDRTPRDNVKFWAGMGGMPGACLARDTLELVCENLKNHHTDDPFSLSAEQSSSFRFDWRGSYIPLDAGFSLNSHQSSLSIQGYPLVELMAAVGLAHARPLQQKSKLKYSYGVAGLADGDLYDPIFLRVALGAREAPFTGLPFRLFTMQLDWPGQENQARCIKNVIEEIPSS